MHFANVMSRECVLFSDLESRGTTISCGVEMRPLLPVGLPPAEYQEVGLPVGHHVTHLKPSPVVPAEYKEDGLPVVPAEQPLSDGADDDLGDLENGEEIDAAKLVRKLKMVKKEHAKLKKRHQEALKASQVWKQKCFDAKDEAKVWHDTCCQEKKLSEVLANKVVGMWTHNGCNAKANQDVNKELAEQLISVVANELSRDELSKQIL